MARKPSDREESSVSFWSRENVVKNVVEGGESNEEVTRSSEHTSGRPEDVGGRRKTRRSAAAGTEDGVVGVEAEIDSEGKTVHEKRRSTVQLEVVSSRRGVSCSGGAPSRSPWSCSVQRRGKRGKRR
jgi:hypothetical protein